MALFHLFLLLLAVVGFAGTPFPDPLWVQVLWHIGYVAAIIAVVLLKRWGAWLYLGLTSANLIIRFLLKDPNALSAFTDAVFPLDIIVSFLILFFYKRFE